LSEAILNQIIEAEQEAARIEENSRTEARELVAKARQEAAAILEKGRAEGEAQRAEILKSARQELEMEAKAREEAVEKAALELSRGAEQKLDSAVQFILGRIVDSSGSR
jgi:V/A-type H+-transporting ATPase subunit G/H